jgi:hypothetical protein
MENVKGKDHFADLGVVGESHCRELRVELIKTTLLLYR